MNISELDIKDLVAFETAASILRKRYEDEAVMYRTVGYDYDKTGTPREEKKVEELTKKIAIINSVRTNILNEMEKKIMELK